jgi:hypothetical protein
MPKLVPNRGKAISSKEEFINGGSDDNSNLTNSTTLSIQEQRMITPRGQLIHTYDDDEKVARTYRIRKKYIIAIAEQARNETDIRAKKKVTETDILDRIFEKYFNF